MKPFGCLVSEGERLRIAGIWVWLVFAGVVLGVCGQELRPGDFEHRSGSLAGRAGAAAYQSVRPIFSGRNLGGLAGPEPTARLELFYVFGKTPVLQIAYPWKPYSRASVELRFFSLQEPDDERIQPLFFRSRYWKGELLSIAYDCLLRAAEVPVQRTFSADKQDWHLAADLGLLGRPALMVVREIPADPRLRTQPATAVIYPLLEQWAKDDYHLCLELPARDYPQPAQLRIWFLRDNRIIWTQKLSWPGWKAAGSPSLSQGSQRPPTPEKSEEKVPGKAAPGERET